MPFQPDDRRTYFLDIGSNQLLHSLNPVGLSCVLRINPAVSSSASTLAMRNRFKEIMIVEDDASALLCTLLVLEDLNLSERITCKFNGEEALKHVRQHCVGSAPLNAERCPELILLDINMPVMDGLEFLESLHQLDQLQLINNRIVMLTTSLNERDQETARSLGVRHYLEKPLTEDKLMTIWGEPAPIDQPPSSPSGPAEGNAYH